MVSSFCLRCCFLRVIMGLYSKLFLGERFLFRDVFEVTNMSEIIKANPHGCDDGALTDRFGVLIQGLLAIIAFSTLMCKFLFLKSSQTWQRFAQGDRNKAVPEQEYTFEKIKGARGVLLTRKREELN